MIIETHTHSQKQNSQKSRRRRARTEETPAYPPPLFHSIGPLLLLLLFGADGGLRGGDARDGDAVRGAGGVVQAQLLHELHLF